MHVSVLRGLLGNYHEFLAYYESSGNDVVTSPIDGEQYSLWDLQIIVQEIIPLLPPRQRQATILFLVQNYSERDTAAKMGLAEGSPVAMYVTDALVKLSTWSEDLPPLKADMDERLRLLRLERFAGADMAPVEVPE